MRKIASNVLSKADLFPAQTNLKANSRSSVKSGTTGIISLIIGIAFLAYLITRLVEAFQLGQLRTQTTIGSMNRTLTKANFSTFGVSVQFYSIKEMEQMFSLYLWVYSQGNYEKSIAMRPCVAKDWAELGDGYEEQFYDADMDVMFCPDTDDRLYLRQIFGDNREDYLNLQIYKCNPDVSEKCQPEVMQEMLRGQTVNERGFTAHIYILSTIVYPDQFDAVQPFLHTDTKARIRETSGEELFIEFSTFNMTTDTSIFPIKYESMTEGTQVSGYRSIQIGISNLTNAYDDYKHQHPNATNDTNATNQTNSTTPVGEGYDESLGATAGIDKINLPRDRPLISAFFTMNEKIITYQRSVKKITEYLAEFGGFASIIIAVLGFFIGGYNAHKYELGVADKAFKEDQRKMKADDFNLLTYIKFSIYTYSNQILGGKLKWEDCKKLEYTKKESGGLMQIDSIFKRLQTLETMVRYSTDRHEMKVIRLVEPLTIREAEEERLTLAYYAKVVKKGTYAPTIRDMRHTYDLREASLEELCIPISTPPNSAKTGSEQGQVKLGSSPSLGNSTSKILLVNQLDKEPKKSKLEGKSQIIKKDSKASNGEIQNGSGKQTKDDFETLRNCISQFKQIKQEAESINLSSRMKKIELKLAKSFSKIRPETRAKMQERMPIIILHRLFMALDKYKLEKKRLKEEKKIEKEKNKMKAGQVKADKKEKKIDQKDQQKIEKSSPNSQANNQKNQPDDDDESNRENSQNEDNFEGDNEDQGDDEDDVRNEKQKAKPKPKSPEGKKSLSKQKPKGEEKKKSPPKVQRGRSFGLL